MPTIRDLATVLEDWAPKATAQSYDNVGLQIGDASQEVSRAVIALDLTPQVIDEAREAGAGLIITHHPLIFRPLRRLTASDGPEGLAYRLAREGLALYSIHTNLDAARDGVSFALAQTLGLEDVRFLEGMKDSLHKLVVFVPVDHLEAVRQAAADAGAGQIGEYDSCAFAHPGTGFFRPGAQASPFIGSAGGELERVDEIRLEMEVTRWSVDRVLGAIGGAHPYEEVAYDLYDVRQPYSGAGLGAIGRLPEPASLSSFLDEVAARLDVPAVRYAGAPEMPIERVAVCGGSGSDFIRTAISAGADAYVTADVTYHTFFDVMDASGRCRMALVDPGHYETEAVTESLLVDFLADRMPEVEWIRTRHRTNPVRYHIHS